jgi:hypothetical protein
VLNDPEPLMNPPDAGGQPGAMTIIRSHGVLGASDYSRRFPMRQAQTDQSMTSPVLNLISGDY